MRAEELIAQYKALFNRASKMTDAEHILADDIRHELYRLDPKHIDDISDWHESEIQRIDYNILLSLSESGVN